jgi:hypothetical protein
VQYFKFFQSQGYFFMKSSRVLFLCVTVMLGSALNAIITHGGDRYHRSVDLGKYLSGNYVDANGQTLFHIIAQNCDDDNFKAEIKVFDFLENKLPAEVDKLGKKGQLFEVMQQLSPGLAGMAMALEMVEFIEIKDNNGETALDLAKKRNVLSGHKRCDVCVTLLEVFEQLKNAQ